MQETPRRSIGPITATTAGGGAAGAALAQVIVWAYPAAGPIEGALSVLLTLGLGALAGFLVPPKRTGRHAAD